MLNTVYAYFANILENIDDLVLTFAILFLIVFICNVLREILLFNGLFPLGNLQLIIIAEIIGTLEACVMCFEINFIVLEAFGVIAYTTILFLTLIWQTTRPEDYQYDGNPLVVFTKHIERIPVAAGVVNHYARFEFVVLMILAEAIGVLLAYKFLMGWPWKYSKSWSFWNGPVAHMNKYETANEWQASIAGNAVVAGIIEGVFSITQYFLPFYTRFHGLNVIFTDVWRAIFSGCGTYFSGGYYNPIFASALEITTHGYSIGTKIMVYWIAPIIGTLLAIIARRLV